MRVMHSACWLQQEEDQEAVIIVLACSDAQLRLLVWQSDKLTVQDEAIAGEHCLLQVDYHLTNKSICTLYYINQHRFKNAKEPTQW